MNQLNRLLLFFMIFFGPWAAIAYVMSFGLQEADISSLIEIGLVALVSLCSTIAVTLILDGLMEPAARPVLIKAGPLNAILFLADVGIFGVLVYGRYFSIHKCVSGPTCGSFPVIWLALAAMHLCYATTSYLIKFKSSC
jgi:hypothetical protein